MTRALSLLLATTALAAIALPARAADADAPPEAAEGDVQAVVVTGQRVFRQGALDESQIVKTEIFDADSVDRAHAVNVNEVGTSIYRSPNSLRDDSLSPGSGSERCGNRGFSGYRTT